jgi:hypothetical protein
VAVGFADTGTATAVGYDADAFFAGQVDAGTASAVGYAALGVPATPALSAVPDALRLEITTADGTQLVNDFTARRNLSFTVEHNGSGTISFDADLAAFDDGLESALLDPNNLVRVHFGDLPGWPYGVAEGFVTSAPPVKNDDGSWSLQVACAGSWDVLDFGLLWPPAGATGDTREFSYTAGQTGPSWVPAQWGKPYSTNVKRSFRWKHRWPRGWSESKASWVWSSSPEKKSPLGTRQFVSDPFTLTARSYVRFQVAGDETLRLYLNGALIKRRRFGGWKRRSLFTRRLPAGTYVLASSVANVGGGDNRSGFIYTIEQVTADGDHVKWLQRSSSTSCVVKKVPGYFAQVPLPPDGWYPAAVLYVHVGEAAARGDAFHPQIVRTFDTVKDSSGSAWTVKGPAEYDLAISGAELGEKIRALGVDLAMLPGLRLSAWAHRGFDLRDRVKIAVPMGMGWSSRAWPRVRTVGLTHQEQGWTETTTDDAAALTEFGRRELALSGGGVDGDVQADVFAKAAMTTAASPEETIEATITSAQLVDPDYPAPMPFRDFNVADTVLFETIGGYQPVKVMSIRGDEQDDKSVNFTIAGYPV